jgi:hypothetical protein
MILSALPSSALLLPAAGSGGARRKIEGWRRESHGGERGQHLLDCFHTGAVTTLSVAA